jgi:hypothetical protein
MARGKLSSGKVAQKKRLGQKIKLMNLSGVDKHCAQCSRRLPRNGMVVMHEKIEYCNHDCAEASVD